MAEFNVTDNESFGIDEKLTAQFGIVYKLAELSPRGLISTSGRMGVTELADVIAIAISNFGPHDVDWVVTLEGVVVATIHSDDSVTYP